MDALPEIDRERLKINLEFFEKYLKTNRISEYLALNRVTHIADGCPDEIPGWYRGLVYIFDERQIEFSVNSNEERVAFCVFRTRPTPPDN